MTSWCLCRERFQLETPLGPANSAPAEPGRGKLLQSLFHEFSRGEQPGLSPPRPGGDGMSARGDLGTQPGDHEPAPNLFPFSVRAGAAAVTQECPCSEGDSAVSPPPPAGTEPPPCPATPARGELPRCQRRWMHRHRFSPPRRLRKSRDHSQRNPRGSWGWLWRARAMSPCQGTLPRHRSSGGCGSKKPLTDRRKRSWAFPRFIFPLKRHFICWDR